MQRRCLHSMIVHENSTYRGNVSSNQLSERMDGKHRQRRRTKFVIIIGNELNPMCVFTIKQDNI